MDKFRKLRLQTGIASYENHTFGENMYRFLAERLIVEFNVEAVMALGGEFMTHFRTLRVHGFERPEKMGFRVITTDHTAGFQSEYISDVSVASMGLIAGLEYRYYEEGGAAQAGVLPGFAMLANGFDVPEKLMEIMAGVAAALAKAVVAEFGKGARFGFAYGEQVKRSLPFALRSPLVPHVIRYSGCRAVDLLRLLQEVVLSGAVQRQHALLFHYIIPRSEVLKAGN